MTSQERETTFNELQAELTKVCVAKSVDYAGKEDILLNFKTIAEALGMTKYQTWSVYAYKHWSAITNAIKHDPETPKVESEPLEGRIVDLINYLRLLHCLLVEDKAKRQKKKLKVELTEQLKQNQLANQQSITGTPEGYLTQ